VIRSRWAESKEIGPEALIISGVVCPHDHDDIPASGQPPKIIHPEIYLPP